LEQHVSLSFEKSMLFFFLDKLHLYKTSTQQQTILPPLSMAPFLINVTASDESNFLPEGTTLALSNMKYGDDTTRSYPFKFISVNTTTPEKQFHCGLRFVFTSEASALDVTYASGNGSILVRLADNNTEVNRVVAMVETELKKLLGPTEAHLLSPIIKEPTNSMYDPALSLKVRKTAVDMTQSSPYAELTRGHTLVRHVITVNRVNHFNGKYYAALNLTACVIQPTPQRDGGSACGGLETETDYFEMMNNNTASSSEIPVHA
jgi:hypothetical protein